MNKRKIVLIFLGFSLLINVYFRILSRVSVPFSEWYAANVYPIRAAVWGRIWGIFPFAVVEFLLYLLCLALLAGIVFLIIRLIKNKGKRAQTLINAILTLSCTISVLAGLFLFGCEINYNRLTFAEHSDLLVEMYDNEDLRAVLDEVTTELHRLVPLIETDENGAFVIEKSRAETHSVARRSMRSLAELHPVLDTYYPSPKPVLLSRQILSPTMTGGIYSPFTIEALYNADMPDSSIPFTMTHELSHLSGFMREDEANFIAFLACRESDDVDFLYSGYLNVLVYLLNAYAGEASDDEYYEVAVNIPEQVRQEFLHRSEYWEPFRDKTIANVASTVNDTYLKVQGQSDGVKSYGRMVDLVLADYKQRNNH